MVVIFIAGATLAMSDTVRLFTAGAIVGTVTVALLMNNFFIKLMFG